ncbi:MAG TPA: pantetheine-phosphate adenylyltransferase [Nitrospirales bacterium]|nr:pantetheine-phosphate adenylyltransferase [Nitrospirales bacterium]
MRIGVYPGTFDPITNGHVDLIARGLRLFDKIYVAVAPSPRKAPTFDLAERVEMVRLTTKDLPNVEVEPFHGLLVTFVRERGAHGIIRGLRAVSDFEYEFQMALMNRKLDLDIETVFLLPSQEYIFLTSTIVKEVASLGGDLSGLLHPEVSQRLVAKLRGPGR